MKGVASLDTGQNSLGGVGSHGASSSTPISTPEGWHIADGYMSQGASGSGPGIKATIPRPTRRWLNKLRRSDIMDARIEKVVDAMTDDDTIDEILAMLDVRSPQCSSFVPNAPTVNAYLLEPKSPSRFTIRFPGFDSRGSPSLTITEAKPIDDRWKCFFETC